MWCKLCVGSIGKATRVGATPGITRGVLGKITVRNKNHSIARICDVLLTQISDDPKMFILDTPGGAIVTCSP